MGAGSAPGDEATEVMAKAIHEDYRQARDQEGAGDLPAARAWEDLTPQLKAQNRSQALDYVSKLASIGLRLVPMDADGAVESLTLDQELTLARREHERWAKQKRDQGYEWGAERVDDPPDRRHPDLVAWEELSAADQEKDRAPMRRILPVLSLVGYAVAPDGGAADSGPGS